MEILCAALSTETSELLCLSKTHDRLHLACGFDALKVRFAAALYKNWDERRHPMSRMG
jgi:hypothetical protein